MNRYDVASVAKFNPLTFQEIMMAPLAMRAQHDASIAKAQASSLEIDPLDVHSERSFQLKNEMDNKIRSEIDSINKDGFNPGVTQNITKLNREYQDLMAPTGEVGQINNAKKVYAENFKDYLEDATKNKGWSREQALINWNSFSNKYTGYDSNNNKKITNIGSYGAPKKIEVLTVLKDVKDLLGEQVVNEISASGYSFDPRPDGSIVMVDSKGRRIETSNKPNLQHAQNLINQKLMGKEWQDSIKFEGENVINVYNQLTSGINSMITNKVVDNRSQDAQYIAPKEDKNKIPENSNIDAYDIGTGKVFDTNKKIMDELSDSKPSILKDINNSIKGFTNEERGAVTNFDYKPSSKTTLKTRSDEYKKLASKINRTLPQGKQFKVGSIEEESAVKSYLSKYGNNVVKNRIVDPYGKPSDLLFASETLSKGNKMAQENLWKRVKNGGAEIVDEDGNEISSDQLANVTKFSYDGDITAESNIKVFKKDVRQNIMPHYGTIVIGSGKDAKLKKIFVSRNTDDFKTPQWGGAQDKNKLSILKAQPNIYHPIKLNTIKAFENFGMKNVEIKYNDASRSYDISYKDYNGVSHDTSLKDDDYGDAETRFNKLLIDGN